MTDSKKNKSSDTKGAKLRSALRENLKKRKGQMRKLGQDNASDEGFSVKLRAKDIPKSNANSGNSDKE